MSDRPQDNRMSGARAGAQFYKCAFRVNPHDYAQKYRGRPPEFDEAGYARALIDNAEALDINVLAVTDHNSVNGVDAIRAVARERNIVVFPGFELTAKEGIHVVCLYEPKTSTTQLGRFLGQLGVLDTTGSSDPCAASFSEVLAQVADQGGVTIAAHVTQDNGLLKVLQGQARINAWRDENLLAIQIPGAVDELPNEEKKIVRNRNAHYARKHAPEEALALAVVNAKDVAEPDDLANCSATCFVKMSEVGVEGLRQAFLDPGSRIRLNSDPTPEEHSELVSLAWQGGFLADATVYFNSNLNVLVGGRGAGKSTVVESLRYALDLEPLGEGASRPRGHPEACAEKRHENLPLGPPPSTEAPRVPHRTHDSQSADRARLRHRRSLGREAVGRVSRRRGLRPARDLRAREELDLPATTAIELNTAPLGEAES